MSAVLPVPEPFRVKVKICGLTRVPEALQCAAAGADWIGLNFHPASPRRVDPETAAAIRAALPERVEAVGLFVDRPVREVAAVAGGLGLSIVQLHGSEPPEDVLELRSFFVIRAFRLGDKAAIDRMASYLETCHTLGRLPDAVLVDGYAAGKAGGTGQTIPGDLLRTLPPLPRMILAGGLTPENVAGRIELARPWMVDVASGVESLPGRKDPARVAAFVRAARGILQNSAGIPCEKSQAIDEIPQ